MNKSIYIGELSLSVALSADGRAETGVGDWAVNAAAIDGRLGLPVGWLGEVASGVVGDHILAYLQRADVDVKAVDRFTEGVSPVRVFNAGEPSTTINYNRDPADPFNVVWPRIEEGDVVVYGSYMTLEERNHERLLDFLKYAKARKAQLVYLPYFEAHQVPRITRVMPSVFDCLELADLVVGRDAEVRAIFPGGGMDAIFKSHIFFYCRRFLHLDPSTGEMQFFDGGDSVASCRCRPTAELSEFQWSAGVLAGVVRALAEGRLDAEKIMACGCETACSPLAESVSHPCCR